MVVENTSVVETGRKKRKRRRRKTKLDKQTVDKSSDGTLTKNTDGTTTSIKSTKTEVGKRGKRGRNLYKQKLNQSSLVPCDRILAKCNRINVKYQPVITKDSKYIISPCGNRIAIFRRTTGLLVNVFSGHNHHVTNVYINHQDPTQIISCSSSEFLVWDYEDVLLSKQYSVPFNVVSWYVSPKCYADVYCKRKNKTNEELVKWNINDSDCEPTVIGNVSNYDKCVAISPNGDSVIYAYKNRLFVYNPSDNTSNSYKSGNTHINCVAFHPTESIVATSHSKGKIKLWYNLFCKEEHVCTKLHWHSTAVSAIMFTNDGNYLFSGGKEGVLVAWQLETKEKSFVPRVGSAIQHLVQSSDEQYVFMTLDNNMLKIINTATHRVMKTIKFLAPGYELPAGLSYHSPSDCLVLNGRPDGVLQFYHAKEDNLKQCIDVIGENRISDVKGRYVYPTRVKLVAFSADGMWMATVDEREDRILPTDRKLKFWKYSEDDKTYSLNTLVDPPHKNTVNSLLFRPRDGTSEYEHVAMTTSEDGDIKMWVVTEENTNDGNSVETWQIQGVGNYGSSMCQYASFSQDGALLAVLFSVVTLWDPETLTFKRCLQYNAKDDAIKRIAFGYHESNRHLLGHSSNYLIVWDVQDIAACSVLWMLEANVRYLTCDPFSKYCAVFVNPNPNLKPNDNPNAIDNPNVLDLYLFDPASHSPTTSYRNVMKDYSTLSSALFVPRLSSNKNNITAQTGRLYILTNDTEILTVEDESKEDEKEENKENISGEDEKSAFKDLFSSFIEDETLDSDEDTESASGDQHRQMGNPTSVVMRKIISSPANVLPPTNIMCKAYLKSLIVPRKVSHNSRDPDRNETKTDDMEGDVTNQTVGETVGEDSIGESIVMKDASCDNNITMSTYTPSKELLGQLRNLNFDFVKDGFK